MGDKRIEENVPIGFYSTYDRLMDRFSLGFYSGLEGVQLLICVHDLKSLCYKKTIFFDYSSLN